MIGVVVAIALAAGGLWVALPTVAQILSVLQAWRRQRPVSTRSSGPARLLFLVPAHDEELLIGRCLKSLAEQTYPGELFEVLVVADNCSDRTAAIAKEMGVAVLERFDAVNRGKHYALGWTYDQIDLSRFDAVVIVDADTIVNPIFATRVAGWPNLDRRAIQTAAGFTNEFETWLTRLGGLFNRYHYRVEFGLKARAGLSVPLTGNGSVIGTALLRRLGWDILTITEGWELYARYTADGTRVDFEPEALHITQEARSVEQGTNQRSRWSSGRLRVARLYGKALVTRPGIVLLQRLDAVAELLSGGPVHRAIAGGLGVAAVAISSPPGKAALMALWATGFLQPMVLSVIALRSHPEPGPTVAALARLPGYALWRATMPFRRGARGRQAEWVRTERHTESIRPTKSG